MKVLSSLKLCSALIAVVALCPTVCLALVPLLPPVKAIELPPPNVKPIAAKELVPYLGKPMVVAELKPVAAIEAPYEYQTAQLTQPVAVSEQNTPSVSTETEVSAPEPSVPVFAPVVHPPGATAADYNPQAY